MALATPIPACEHSTFAIGRRAPRGVSVLGLGAAAQEQIAGMGLVRRFQQAPDVLLRTVPRRPARRGIVFTAFSRRRVGLRGAQETIRDPARKANFFGFPGTASSRQRLFCGTGLSPPAPHLQVRPFEPWCEPTRARCICVATCVCDFAASAGPSAPQSARLRDARVYQPEATISVGDVRDHAIDHRVSAGDERLFAQAHARIVEDPHAEMLVWRNDVDGVHGDPCARTKETPISPKGGRLSRGLQLALFEALLSRRLPGVLGGRG